MTLLLGQQTFAQTASPFYTGACKVEKSSESEFIVGNVLSYLNKREFGGKNVDEADVDKTSTDLKIGGLKKNDYYTFVLDVDKAGAYTIALTAAVKNSTEYTVEMLQAAVSSLPKQGATDKKITYTSVGKQTMPSLSSYTPPADYNLSFDVNLKAGVNYIKLLFDGGKNYCGNIGKMKIASSKSYAFTWTTSEGSAKDEDQKFSDGSKYTYRRIATSDPVFKLLGTSNVYSDSRFKFGQGQEFAIVVPSNVTVSKITFTNCCENYYKKNGDTNNIDSEWDYIKSEGATVEISNSGKIESAQDITATLTGHQAGMPILYCVKKCAQVAFSSLVIQCTIDESAETYTLSVSDAGAATLVLPFGSNIPDGLKAYRLTAVNGNKITAEELTETVPANTPVLVNAAKGDYTFTSNGEASMDIVPQSGLLTGVWTASQVAQDNYVLQMQSGKVAFYPVKSDDISLKARQAYLTIPDGQASANKLTIDFGTETGISQVNVAGKENVDAIYNAAGMRVKSMNVPGLYIKNGKKYIIK